MIKKIAALLAVTIMVLALCSCGGNEAEKVASGLEGTWSWSSALSSDTYVFSDIDGNAGRFKYYSGTFTDNSAGSGGTFGVHPEDKTVVLTFQYSFDSSGKMTEMEKASSRTLNYTFEKGNVALFRANGAEFTHK